MGQEKALPWKNWEVVKLIGKGTYGDVYEIRKENTQYAARAALKVIHVSLDEQKRRELESERISLASYLQETQANITSEINIMESLKSASHIVAIEDSEIQEGPDGWTLFIRMELLKSLVQLRSERNLTMKEILKLGLDLCDGLQACRKKGVIHRDIKPANIFISEFGEYKLGDFGISKQLEHTMSGSTRAGTESYMAPEVFYGKVYDATVDLYSLGIVLYQLANKGKLPFVPQDREVVSYSDVTKAKQRRLKGEILPDPAMGGHVLGDILRKACAVNPRDRYQSPQEMYEELEKLLQSYDQNQKDQETAKVSEKERAEEDIHFFSGLEDDLEKTEAEKTESVKPERVIVQPVKPENKTPKTPKKSSKMPAIIGILCIAGIAIAAFGYMRMGNSQKIESKENQEVSVTAIPTISAAPTEAPIETPTEAPVPTVEISPTEAALEENTEETDWFNDFDNRDSEETDWFDDWNYDENGNKVN